MKKLQNEADFTSLMALSEGAKLLPLGDVWAEYLEREGVPYDYLSEVKKYEKDVLSKRV